MNQYFLSFLILCLAFYSCIKEAQVIDEDLPMGFLLPQDALAEYEKNIDHASLIETLDESAFYRGQDIYKNTCYTCHGDPGQEGSIPTSTKFWAANLKNGSDPYAMYETLTRGYGLMTPQVQLVPRQKYDVIHFIREYFIKDHDGVQYFEVDSNYLASLPQGTIEGPEATAYKPWAEMNYGNFLINTYEVADSTTPPRIISGGPSPLANEPLVNQNFAYKGIAVRVDEGDGGIAAGDAFVMFDADLMRVAGAWTGEGFIDYQAILMNERHNIYPRTVGDLHFENDVGPGWANPKTGNYNDPRFQAVDQRKFGPLPYDWAKYKGLYRYENKVILSYTIGSASVLESFGATESDDGMIFSRTMNISAPESHLKMRVAPDDVSVQLISSAGASIKESGGYHELHIPTGKEVKLKLLISRDASLPITAVKDDDLDLSRFINGGPAHYPEKVSTQVIKGMEEEAYTADVLSLPLTNPWKARVRPTGIDFIPDTDEAVVCTIDGDVWIVGNITSPDGQLEWQRIASGLFQPLGIVYHEEQIFVTCRDQLVVLRDLNGDRETDFYEAYNTDHQVTEHFHEFAMGLQIDDEGNFYYAKSARHARTALIPQHGTLIKVSPDGTSSQIIAKGFRAANGVCLNPDGSFYVTDQEGHWNPMNRINHVTKGGFYGNMYGYGAPDDSSDEAMLQPLCWIDMRYDRSPSELLWAESDKWGPLNDQLLNISYGYGKVFLVLDEEVNGVKQGGMVQLPLPEFPSGLVRGRFHPEDGQMYACAMTAWATSQVLQAGGLYRIRYTGKDLNLPIKLETKNDGIELTFSNSLDETTAKQIENYTINTWQLKRTKSYGSKRYDEKGISISDVRLENGKVILTIPDLEPTWVIEIKYDLKDQKGNVFDGAIQGTVYELDKTDL